MASAMIGDGAGGIKGAGTLSPPETLGGQQKEGAVRREARLGLVLAALVGAGCIVEIDHTTDARAAFREARSEALRYQGWPGPAHELNVLVFDPGEEHLVRVSLPMWVCRKLEGRLDFDDEREERAARAVRRHVHLKDIERAGLGLLLEAEEESGERVLVWLR